MGCEAHPPVNQTCFSKQAFIQELELGEASSSDLDNKECAKHATVRAKRPFPEYQVFVFCPTG
jgi:hypothetical protein